MNKILIILIVLLLSLTSFAQIDDILKKTVDVPELLEEKSITTSLDDAYPVAFWLDDLDEYLDPVEPTDYSFVLAPGYYRFTVQTYCLKAGTHGPAKGSGYLLAPLKGKRAELVKNILVRSSDHPEIIQEDIQLLLWAIIYGVKFTDLEPGLQTRLKPLLTDGEIADLSIGIKDIPYDLLPDDVKEKALYYKDLRGKLTNPSSNFEEIESMAVLPGDPPSSLLAKNITPGNWAYGGDGFYYRIFTEDYTRSVLEVYRPAAVNVTRDELSRITSFENDGYRVEVAYHDEPGSDVLFADGKYFPIYRFKYIKYLGTNPGEELIMENEGWMIRGNGKEIKNVSAYKNYTQDPGLQEYLTRLKEAKAYLKKISEYKKNLNKPTKGSEQDISDDLDPDQQMKKGMKAVQNPLKLKQKFKWIEKNTANTTDHFNNSSSILGGGSGEKNNNEQKANPQNKTFVPGNNGAQRLGISTSYSKDDD